MDKIVVGYISSFDPGDRKALSGTPYKLHEQIKEYASEVVWIKASYDWQARAAILILKAVSTIFGKNSAPDHIGFVARRLSASLSKKKEEIERADVLFAPFGSQYLYKIKTCKPVIYLSDATFCAMQNYYPRFTNLFGFNIRQGNKIERAALDKSWRIIASSDWVGNSMVNDYGTEASKIRVIEFGANIDDKDIIAIEGHKPSDNKLRMLFLGVEWERKGGDTAVACLSALRQMGVDAELYVVGANIPSRFKDVEGIIPEGFLNKNVPEQYDRLVSMIKKSDLLLLPTKAECAGIVFCEAGAYGLPVFTYDTGGIPNYVENGINGYRLPLSAEGKDFALKIKEVAERGELENLARGGRLLYENKLNWPAWGKQFKKVLDEL